MPEHLSDKELKWGYWFFLHREKIKQTALIVGIALTAGIWIYGGWQWVDWFSSRKADQEMLRLMAVSQVNWQAYESRNNPVPLTVGVASSVPGGQGKYVMVAEVKNANSRWGALQLAYTFTADDKTVSGNTFVLPADSTYVVSQPMALPHQPQQVSIVLDKVEWKKVADPNTFPVPSFSVTDQSLTRPSTASAGETSPARLRFTLTNTSAYNFWQTLVTVVLTAGGSVQVVGQQTLTDVASQGSYPVEFYWPRGVPPTDHVIVKPTVNVLDPAAVKPL